MNFVFKVALPVAVLTLLGSCKVAGHRKAPDSGSDLLATAGEACSESALEKLIIRLGVIAALAADESACLDKESTAIVASDESVVSDSGFNLGETPEHRLRLQVLIGWRVINDLLDNVAQDAVNGTNRGGHTAADIGRLREQVTRSFDGMRPALTFLKATAQVDVIYSYSDLYETVKSRFVDPLVYGYDGPLHRVIHRRYSRGRGLVYRIATQKLAEALYQFHGVAQRELAGFSDATFGLNLGRHQGSLATAESSFLTLIYNQKVLGRPVSYAEVKELAETAKREIPSLMNSPAGQTVANNALSAAQEAATALGINPNDPETCQCRSDGQSCSLYKGGRRIFFIPGHQSCNANGARHCETLEKAAGGTCARTIRL